MDAESGRADSDPQDPQLVFVYGTLKRGQPNHHHLSAGSSRGEAQLPGLALFDLGPFPMAIASSDPNACLQGELYAVTGDQLAALDHVEGAPRLYQRQRHRLADGRLAWVYVGRARQVRHAAAISSGVWRGRRTRNAALLLPLWLLLGQAVLAGDLRRDCLAFHSSHGLEQVAIANRIGQEQLLTKDRQLAQAQPGDTTSLYRWNDIARLCRRQ